MKGTFKKFDKLPQEVVKDTKSVMNMEAVVDATPQDLRTMRTYSAMLKEVPKDIVPEGQIVMHALFACFDKQGKIEEGKFEDLVWGFEQGQIPRACTLMGVKDLEKKGYIQFQAPDNAIMEMGADRISESWIKYTPKLMNLVYENKDKKVENTPLK